MSLPAAARRPWLIYGIVALAFAGAIWYFGFFSEPPKRVSQFPGGGRSRGANTASPVRAVRATRGELPVHLRAIGTVTPLNTVTVRSRVDGQLLRIDLVEGQQVDAGKLLAEIDPLPYQIKLTQAEARLRQDQAQVQTAKADLDRFKQLGGNLVTQQQLEAQQALVADREGALGADQAMVEDARRQLAYTKIEAPINGRLGLRQVDAGNLIRANDVNGLVVLTQTKPISVMFTVPEIDLQKVLDPIRAGETLTVEAWDRNEQTRLAVGQLKTIDNQIDLSTGTLKLKAEFANDDEKLFPNQFVNVRLHVRTLKDAVLVPSAVVQYGSRGTYVYLVNEQSQATIRDVVLGPSDGAMQAVQKGLEGGEQVILEGLDRLREGRPVLLVAEDGQKAPPPGPGGDKGDKGEKGKGKKKKKDQ